MIKEINILWDKFTGINGHHNQFYTSIGELDLENCTDFSEIHFDVLTQDLSIFFKTNKFADPIVRDIISIEFKFSSVESFFLGIGIGWSPPPLDLETHLTDLAIFKTPIKDKEVHIQFHMNSGRIIDIRSGSVELFLE